MLSKSVVCIAITKTRQIMHVHHNIDARSRNHCCCGKAISVTYSECVSGA